MGRSATTSRWRREASVPGGALRGSVVRSAVTGCGPEPLQPVFLGGDGLFLARNDALPQGQLRIEFGAHFRDTQVGRGEHIPEVVQVARFVPRPVAQRQQLFNHDFFYGVDLHGGPVRQVVKTVVDALYGAILQRET